jgi:hypothetical protein
MAAEVLQPSTTATKRTSAIFCLILRAASIFATLSQPPFATLLSVGQMPGGMPGERATMNQTIFRCDSAKGKWHLKRLSTHEWNKRPQDCSLYDRASCPRTSPTQVTAKEVPDMRDSVLHDEMSAMS